MKLTIDHLSKEYVTSTGETVPALADVSLSIGEREFVCLLGPSGCGKTTLLRIIAGLDTATGGAVRVNGTEILSPTPKMAMIFQEYSLYPWRNVIDNITFGLELQEMEKAERLERAREYLQLVGLAEFADSFPYELSGGMRQRIAVARALAVDPDVLLMDEPFGALDAQTRNMMQEELLEIWQKTQKTIIFVTHSVDEAVYLADRIFVFSQRPGRLCEEIGLDLKRPRDRTDAEFARIRRHVLDLMQRCQIFQ